ncbi:MAG TPA: energy-coupling factor transporter transmembrane component T [Dehalococcoidia bacterium]
MLEGILEVGAVPGETPVHRLWAGTKLLITLALATTLALTGRIWAHFAVAALLLLAIMLARLSPGLLWRGIRPLLFALGIGVVLLVFTSDGTPIVHVGPVVATQKGVADAVRLPGFLLLLAIAAAIVNRTTPPAESVAALGVLFHPLRWVRVPVDELLTMCAISLRFLPIMAEEVTRLRQAQATRGLALGQGSLESRSRAVEGWIAALINGNLRRAAELGEAMNARGYGDAEVREFPVQWPRLGWADGVAATLCLLLVVAAIVIH